MTQKKEPTTTKKGQRATLPLAPQAPSPHGNLDEELRTIFSVVKELTGHDFSSYKTSTAIRRIERRMMVNDVTELSRYLELLRDNPQEAVALVQDILIGVTSFFRDPDAFDAVATKILPRLFARRSPDDPVRIWHAGCASGEEVYSMAMLIREYLDRNALRAKVQIFATDIDEVAVAQARAGLYDEAACAALGEERLATFFVRNGAQWQVVKSLREMVVFAQHSLIKDPPFSRLDLLVCRNFLIYVKPELQRRLMALFHQVLKPGGFLFLGSAESAAQSELFVTLDKKWKLFARREGVPRGALQFPLAMPIRLPTRYHPALQPEPEQPAPVLLAQKAMLEAYAPPGVLVNEKYEALHIFPGTGTYLRIPEGEPTRDLLKMAREELRPPLRAAMYKSLADHKEVVFKGIRLGLPPDEGCVNVVVRPLSAPPASEKLLLVIFEQCPHTAAPPLPAGDAAPQGLDEDSRSRLIRQLEEQLRVTHEQLKATTEQLESSNEGFLATSEELMSINEEFQSANEELQSTNEELETSKEELQALNEELVTVNAELQGKVEELNLATTNMENLLASSGVATVFLDQQLDLKGFTPAAAAIFGLIQRDIGRSFRHFAHILDWPTFSADARSVLAGAPLAEREVSAAEGEERCYLKRIFPYRTQDGRIDGVVVTLIDITERKRMENELRESEKKFSIMFSKASLPAALSRYPEFIFIDANDAWVELFGFSREELAGKSSAELGIVRNLKVRNEAFSEIRRRNQVLNLEQKVYSKSGEEITVLTNVTLISIGGERFALTTLQNISERKRAEAELVASKMKLEAALASMSDAIFISDHEGRFVNFNDAFVSFHRFKSREECGKTHGDYARILEILLPGGELAPLDQWAVPRALQGETASNVEYTLRRKDTGESWVGSYSFAPIRDDKGAITGAVVAARDVTESKRAEQSMRESEARFRSLVESAQIAIFINRNNRIEYANPAALRLFGVAESEELIGRSPYLFVHPEFHDNMAERIRRLLAGERVPIAETRIVQAGGGERFVEVTAVSLVDHGEQAILVMMQDLTERKQLEEQLRQAQKMEAVGQLAGGVAHDFNNILTVIGGLSNLMQMDGRLAPDQVEKIEQIILAADRAAQLTRGLLAFSRRQVMLPKHADLNQIVQHIQKFLARTIGEDIQFKAVFKAAALPVTVDPGQIEQVLVNLVTNARDAMPRGGELTLETEAQRFDGEFVHSHGFGTPGRYAVITLSDTGCGMDEETRSRIFEPFFTTKEVGKGTGLGMAIVYGIVRQHNGFINVYSEPGCGSTFRIYLPLTQERERSLQEKGDVEAPRQGSETILLAEDEASVRSMVEALLRQFGYQVIVAVDGIDCVEKFRANRGGIDLILMDLIMPRKNGYDAFQEIREMEPEMKVIFTSGYTADFIKSRGVYEEDIDLLMKPVQPLDLVQKVREVLDR
jgi:two-component system, chemotaxis family, CheB/CheR fusion protein